MSNYHIVSLNINTCTCTLFDPQIRGFHAIPFINDKELLNFLIQKYKLVQLTNLVQFL